MAAYCQVYGVIHFTSPAGLLPVHRDQLRAQRSVTSMGKLYFLLIGSDAWLMGLRHLSRPRVGPNHQGRSPGLFKCDSFFRTVVQHLTGVQLIARRAVPLRQ